MHWEKLFDRMSVPDDRDRIGRKLRLNILDSVPIMFINPFIVLYVVSLILEIIMDLQNFK